MANGSPNTVFAKSKLTPCARTLAAALASCHSNSNFIVLRDTSSVNYPWDSVTKNALSKRWHILTLVLSNDSELHAQGVQDRIDGFEAWVRTCTQGLVQAFPAQARVFGDLRHASCLGHVAKGCDEYLGIRIFGSRRKIFRNDHIVIEIRRRVEWFVSCFLLLHGFVLVSSRAIFFALTMSFVCEALTP